MSGAHSALFKTESMHAANLAGLCRDWTCSSQEGRMLLHVSSTNFIVRMEKISTNRELDFGNLELLCA